MDRTPRSVNAIVESQVQRWLTSRPRQAEAPRPPPVITISREYGARGAAVAKLVAERLGCTCWNRELLAAIAAHARVDPAVMAPFDEHHPSALVDTMRGLMPSGAAPSQADYARELRAVVAEIARNGAAVPAGWKMPAVRRRTAASFQVKAACGHGSRIAAAVAVRSSFSTKAKWQSPRGPVAAQHRPNGVSAIPASSVPPGPPHIAPGRRIAILFVVPPVAYTCSEPWPRK